MMIRPETAFDILGWHADLAPAVQDGCRQRDDRRDDGGQPVLETPRRANADEGAHQKPQIETSTVHEEPFQDVHVAAQMRAPHATRFVEVCVRAFQSLTATALQRPPARTANTAAV